ncbi:granzyme A-like [Dendropsophus ebraccatus]|uniref:granzyme A-like n=1 Tax=Dendropsophus ebraccatus TaxID=150705 RepID=UPI003831A940
MRIDTVITMRLLHVLLSSAAYLLISEGAEIVNGRVAHPHSRPYMAYIQFHKDIFCGGTLIDSNWVLTAAHCEVPEANPMVILGAHSRDENEKEEGRQIFNVTRSIRHPNYNDRTLRNDIQLMKLNATAKLGKFVQFLSLPETFKDLIEGTVCETAGWGWTEREKFADHLMEVNITVLNRRRCERHLDNQYITDNMICTSVGPGGQDTCRGDSGGPLICNGIYRGILSFGRNPCGQKNRAAVYTRLTEEYIEWIKTKTGAHL